MTSRRIPKVDEEPPMPGDEHASKPKPEWEPRYAGSQRLAGKVALVTGGDSGTGRAVAVLFMSGQGLHPDGGMIGAS